MDRSVKWTNYRLFKTNEKTLKTNNLKSFEQNFKKISFFSERSERIFQKIWKKRSFLLKGVRCKVTKLVNEILLGFSDWTRDSLKNFWIKGLNSKIRKSFCWVLLDEVGKIIIFQRSWKNLLFDFQFIFPPDLAKYSPYLFDCLSGSLFMD